MHCKSSGAFVAVVASAICAAGATVASPVHAQPPCSQWSFDGYTLLNQGNGWNLTFTSHDSNVKAPARALAEQGSIDGTIDGLIYGDRIYMRFDFSIDSRSDPLGVVSNILGQVLIGASGLPESGWVPAFGQYDGAVDQDGFAYGTTSYWVLGNPGQDTINDTNDRWENYRKSPYANSTSRSANPLKCADGSPNSDVLEYDGVNPDSGAFGGGA